MTECVRCANHDPRDRRDHGHLPSEWENPSPGSPWAQCVPGGWFVVNPRRMAELRAAEDAQHRARALADEWASEPYAEAFLSLLGGVLIDTLAGES